ncbi:DUF2251 domain-containing protein [Methylomicrobium album]|uniref:DUF2251 domain-containing protein n=1 Tax=Methylomicrobium album TaxID=39775 RepID=UPI001BC86CAE|nr:DUF2251 domain-containing protein [Methylomicrobium album]
MEEIFLSAICKAGDYAGVFEYDGETGYFYLYRVDNIDGNKVISAIQIINDILDINESDLSIKWNDDQRMVGIIMKNELWGGV